MNLSTPLRFLFGGRQAIIDIAACRGALFLGALFVISAGFAREYDGEDLLHDPWYVLIPLVASLGTSFVLYCIFALATFLHAKEPEGFCRAYRRFLSVYWMTAPLAWLYAIPVEQFMEPAEAVRANLWLLGIVSVWRVLLITRCASVLYCSSYLAAFFLVMLFADTLALVILRFTPLPIFNIMGGIHLTDSESLIQGTAFLVGFFGVVTWPIWSIATCTVLFGLKKLHWKPVAFPKETPERVSIPLWAVGVLSLLVWIPVLPTTQPAQMLRRQVESDLENGRIELAVAEMSKHNREAFPPHWDPPPWPGYGKNVPPLLDVLSVIYQQPTADWVKEIYLAKLESKLGGRSYGDYYWSEMNDDAFDQIMIFAQNTPEVHDILRGQSQGFLDFLEYGTDTEGTRKPRVRALLTTLGIEVPEVKKPDQDDLASENEPSDEPTPEGDSQSRPEEM